MWCVYMNANTSCNHSLKNGKCCSGLLGCVQWARGNARGQWSQQPEKETLGNRSPVVWGVLAGPKGRLEGQGWVGSKGGEKASDPILVFKCLFSLAGSLE